MFHWLSIWRFRRASDYGETSLPIDSLTAIQRSPSEPWRNFKMSAGRLRVLGPSAFGHSPRIGPASARNAHCWRCGSVRGPASSHHFPTAYDRLMSSAMRSGVCKALCSPLLERPVRLMSASAANARSEIELGLCRVSGLGSGGSLSGSLRIADQHLTGCLAGVFLSRRWYAFGLGSFLHAQPIETFRLCRSCLVYRRAACGRA